MFEYVRIALETVGWLAVLYGVRAFILLQRDVADIKNNHLDGLKKSIDGLKRVFLNHLSGQKIDFKDLT